MHNYQPRSDVYSVSQVAQMLGVKPSTVRAWISRKEIRSTKVNNRRYITQQQIADFYYQRKSGDYVDMTYASGPP